MARLGVALLCFLTAASAVARAWESRCTGLRLTVRGATDATPITVLASDVTSDALLLDPRLPAGTQGARWDGVWQLSRSGECALLLRGREGARVSVDGRPVFDRASGEAYREDETLRLEAGPHVVRAEFEVRGPLPTFKLFLVPPGGGPPAAGGRGLFPEAPSPAAELLARASPLLRRGTLLAWCMALAYGLLRARRRRQLAPVLAVLVVLYAGALRLEAVVREYWGMEAPGWARRTASLVGPLRPGAFKLSPVDHPYPGDPGAYLRFAREMEHFYAAHVREPLYVFAARTGLSAAGGADVGISLTSAAFSTALVGATYLLGAACFGPGVGLGAAFLMAIEPMAVALGADGWRDDAFSFFVALSTLSLVRVQREASIRNGVVAGLAGAAACLTRITTLSLLLPSALFLVATARPDKRRATARTLGLALVLVGLLLAPYLIDCARVFGDPFVSINAHTRFYRTRADLPWDPSMTWVQYLRATFRPGELLENMAVGLTRYPFGNKWAAYDVWLPHLSQALMALSLAGLALFVARAEGRLLLVALLSALLPFAFTWRVPGGNEWRFTLHAYPFYLIAAALALDRGAGLLWRAACRTVGQPETGGPPSGGNVLHASQT